jgi:ADP-ribose pyrophosphatase YjhB (NUDIX family)
MKSRLLRLWGSLPIPVPVRWMLVKRFLQPFHVGVLGVITNQHREILLFRHTYRGRYPWGLPAGWLERDESPEAAIKREIHEETGMQVAADGLLLAWHDTRYGKLDLFYICRILDGAFRPSEEVVEMGWYAAEALPPMLKSQYDMIMRLFELLP